MLRPWHILLAVLVAMATARAEEPPVAPETMPFVLYEDCTPEMKLPYAPSGWMGDTEQIECDTCSDETPHSGKTCIKFTFNEGKWGGIVWQFPPEDWGDIPDGLNLTGAKKLTFWARGEKGGEPVKFEMGILGRDKKFPDSGSGHVNVKLTDKWKQYSISVGSQNLKCIKSGFAWSVQGRAKPTTFYVDDVRYE
jgi:hypothetical protein